MGKSKIKQISLAVCLALLPFSSYAAGLGKLNVSSGLGEPLKAEVELLSVSPEELSTLVAAIASEEAYAEQGIVRLGIHNAIKVEISKNPAGSPVLKLYSNQPISDPYLDMLIQVDWASGRLQREYTVLLDPPEYKLNSNVDEPSSITPPSVSSVAKDTEKSIDSSVVPSKKSKKTSNQTHKLAVSPDSADDQNITTKRGDTLNAIAKEMQIEGVSLDQMLVGLYESNKEAFSSGNMNRLKVGKIIRLPTKESLLTIDSQQAKKSIKVHSANWNAYRNSLAATVSAAATMTESEHKQTASGKITTAVDKAAPVKAGPQDVVKLSAGEKDLAVNNKDAGSSDNKKVAALQEEATAREKTLKDAQERATALEKQIQDMQKLLALKSQAMLDLQKNAENIAKEAAKKAEVNTAAEEHEPAKVEVKKLESHDKAEIKSDDTTPAKVIPEEKKPAKIPQAKPQPPVQEVGLLERLMAAVDLTILGAVSGIALLAAGWMYLRNKRRKDLDSFERGILTSGGLRANTVFGNTTGSASAADTSFLTDFAQSANGSMIDANDVDPIAEAEVYMAYGRDAQAEEILKDAISKEPKRYELHLKLLEMYAGQRDASAFEAVAGELYTSLGGEDPVWAKIAEMGATIEPDNPLYKISKSAGAVDTQLVVKKSDGSDQAGVDSSTDNGLDFLLAENGVSNVQPELEIGNLDTDAMGLQDISESSVNVEPENDDNSITEQLSAEQVTADTEDALEFDLNDNQALSLMATESPALDLSQSIDVEPKTDLALVTDGKEDDAIDFNLDTLKAPLAEANSIELPEADANTEQELGEIKDSALESVMDFDLGDFNVESESIDAAKTREKITDTKTSSVDQAVNATEVSLAKDLPPLDFNDKDYSTTADDNEIVLSSEELPSVAVEVEEPANASDDVAAFNRDFGLQAGDLDGESKKTAQAVASAISDISFDLDSIDEALTENILDLAPVSESTASELKLTDADEDLPKNQTIEDSQIIDLVSPALTDGEKLPNKLVSAEKTEIKSEPFGDDIEANEFDLSGISLELDDALADAGIEEISMDSPSVDSTSLESPDVEIKLDLVAAYIDMDDTEGARELLDEVLKEGGPQQQARAQQLLDSLA